MERRSISRIYDEDNELSSQAKYPSEYSVLKHELHEIPNVPIEPNLLSFSDAKMRLRYFKVLYVNPNTGAMSKEFYYNLLDFYIVTTLYLVIVLAVIILLYSNNEISEQLFYIYLGPALVLLFMAYAILFCLNKSKKAIYHSQSIFMVFGMILYLFMIIGNTQVLSGITSDTHGTDLIPFSIGIIVFTYSFRRILFDSYRYVALTLVPVLIIYLALNLIYSNQNSYSLLGEFAVIAVSLVTQIVESHKVESRTVQLFYRMEKEVEKYYDNEDTKKSKTNQDESHSFTDSILTKIDFIYKEIKAASSVIIFKDVKGRLKIVLTELLNLQMKLRNMDYSEKFEEGSKDIDEEDREFISQNYRSVITAIKTVPNRKASSPKHTNYSSKILTSKYFLTEISLELAKIGVDWNFNIFQIKEETGSCIPIIAMQIFSTSTISQSLLVPEEIYFSYFEKLEQVPAT